MGYGSKEYFMNMSKEDLALEMEKLINSAEKKTNNIFNNFLIKKYSNKIKQENKNGFKDALIILNSLKLVKNGLLDKIKSLDTLIRYMENNIDAFHEKQE